MGIGSLFAFAIIGLIAGALARLLVPGRQPMGIVATMVLGMVGSMVGGGISYAFWPNAEPFHPGGLLMSVLGAVIVLALFVATARSDRTVA